MAFSALKQCRSTMQSTLSTRGLASSTTPKFAASVATTGAIHGQPIKGGLSAKIAAKLGSDWPVLGILVGMTGVAGGIGVHTAVQHIFRNPSVQVTKKRRECMPEVDYPDAVIRSADKFENKSFLRKVAHIQDKHNTNMHANSSTRSRECETLKSVGVHK